MAIEPLARIILLSLGVGVLTFLLWDRYFRNTRQNIKDLSLWDESQESLAHKIHKQEEYNNNRLKKKSTDINANAVKENTAVNLDFSKAEVSDNNIQNIVVLSVLANKPQGFSGKQLLNLLQTSGLTYGKQKIFHYMVSPNGVPEPLFSIAHAFEPGYFELSQLDYQLIKGITLFFDKGSVIDPGLALKKLLAIANSIVTNLDAKLVDQNKRPFTEDTLHLYESNLLL